MIHFQNGLNAVYNQYQNIQNNIGNNVLPNALNIIHSVGNYLTDTNVDRSFNQTANLSSNQDFQIVSLDELINSEQDLTQEDVRQFFEKYPNTDINELDGLYAPPLCRAIWAKNPSKALIIELLGRRAIYSVFGSMTYYSIVGIIEKKKAILLDEEILFTLLDMDRFKVLYWSELEKFVRDYEEAKRNGSPMTPLLVFGKEVFPLLAKYTRRQPVINATLNEHLLADITKIINQY